MSDETETHGEPMPSAADGNSESAQAETDAAPGATDGESDAAKEALDEDGLPLHREVTIDDVRSTEARHGRIAFGCTLIVVLVLVLFWLIRGGVIG